VRCSADWLARQAEHLLPVDYYHLVFKLPDELAELAKANPSTCYDLLNTEVATIREEAVRRTGPGVEVLGSLHAPGGHRQFAIGEPGEWQGELPLQGLCRRAQRRSAD